MKKLKSNEKTIKKTMKGIILTFFNFIPSLKLNFIRVHVIIFKSYWEKKNAYTPEYRTQSHKEQEEMKQKEEDEKKKKGMDYLKDTFKKERRYFSEDGKPYSFNDPK